MENTVLSDYHTFTKNTGNYLSMLFGDSHSAKNIEMEIHKRNT